LTISVYDSDDASESGDTEVCRMILLAGTSGEFDMHGRFCSKGLFIKKVSGTGFFSLEWS